MGRIEKSGTDVLSYDLSLYDFELPKELIAQHPLREREKAKLFVIDRSSGTFNHLNFEDILQFLHEGDVLVLNNTKVMPARIYGKKETGGKVELLVLAASGAGSDEFNALVKPYVEPGRKIIFSGNASAEVLSKNEDGIYNLKMRGAGLAQVMARDGFMPLPPYIDRKNGKHVVHDEQDKQFYQTVYAELEGSIAAPTAGLHFTRELIENIKKKKVIVVYITLHVGIGTFRPVIADDIREHRMLEEYYEISQESAKLMANAKAGNNRVISVGTTATRAIESACKSILEGKASSGFTSLFIYPGHEFKIASAFVTNFHLPKSTPLLMLSAFAGREVVLESYREAIEKRYRFFSYGDAMLVL